METRRLSDEYAEIAMDLIRTEPELEYIRESNVEILFLASDLEKKSKKRVIFGECEKVPDKWKWSVPCDFTITIFEPNVERFTDDQIRILLFHELLHVGIEVDGNEEKYYAAPHDIEDFRTILDRYGMEWNE